MLIIRELRAASRTSMSCCWFFRHAAHGDCGAGGRAGNGAGTRLGFGFAAGWGKWLYLVLVGRENGFVWYFLIWRARWPGRRARLGGGGWDGRECHAGSIVERGKGVVGGKVFVFNEK